MADSSIPITAGSGTQVRVLTALGPVPAAQQVVSLADQYGVLATSGPDGSINVSPGVSSLMYEAFDGTLANQWTTGGTAFPAQANGQLTFNASTTASATSYITSINPLGHNAVSYMQAGWVVQVDTAAALTNSTRWWGYGQNQTTPTSAAPVLNGVVFMLDATAGAFLAAIYSAGTRTQTVTLTKPTDGTYHRYQIYFRTSRAYFLQDGITVATITYPNPAVSNNLFLIAGQANAGTAPTAAPTLVASVASAADGADNNGTISDATYPSVRATVKKANTAVAATDTALAVGLHPTTQLPSGTNTLGQVGVNAGTNLVGAVSVGSTTRSSSFTTSTTTNTATVAKASAGDLQTLLIANTAASAQYVKLYNATADTLGTTAAVIDVPVAAGTTISLNLGANGLRMTTGIAYAVTGAAGLTNNTAGAGGVSVAITYV
jgi:hypothetical protein